MSSYREFEWNFILAECVKSSFTDSWFIGLKITKSSSAFEKKFSRSAGACVEGVLFLIFLRVFKPLKRCG